MRGPEWHPGSSETAEAVSRRSVRCDSEDAIPRLSLFKFSEAASSVLASLVARHTVTLSDSSARADGQPIPPCISGAQG
eukprot:217936-Hanusia_phi.AAC.1